MSSEKCPRTPIYTYYFSTYANLLSVNVTLLLSIATKPLSQLFCGI